MKDSGAGGNRPAVRDREPGRAEAVRRMFSALAPRYDLLNHLLSLNIDRRWRRKAVDRLLEHAPADGTILDACAGTLDLARELAGRDAFRGRVFASDFAVPMLVRGVAKVAGLGVGVAAADTLMLPLASASIDGAMVGFGVRNLEDLDVGLTEFARILRPGAPLVVLEFTTPPRQPLRAAYLLYFRRILPLVGRFVSGHDAAYDYLPESVLAFPEPAELAARMQNAGFSPVRYDRLSGGIAAIHSGLRTLAPAHRVRT
jgi:demethylmenaquinone methyltransferase/2-methoxy-6-polyprenyl-1,4-benzoquinol methylase